MTLERKGIEFVKKYERKQGREPYDVSRKRNFIGFDLMSVDRKGHHRTIEVKSTTTKGIPDAFETEFTRGLKFVATHLYLVRFSRDRKKVDSLHILKKEDIDRYSGKHRMVQHIKFASSLKTAVGNDEFQVELE